MVGGEEIASQVGAVLQRDVVGGSPDGRRRYPDRLGETPEVHLGYRPVAGSHVLDAVSDLQHRPRHVHAGHVGQVRLVLVEPLRLQRVGILHAGKMRPDHDVAGLADRRGYLVQRQNVPQGDGLRNGFAGLVEAGVAVAADSLHRVHGDSGNSLRHL